MNVIKWDPKKTLQLFIAAIAVICLLYIVIPGKSRKHQLVKPKYKVRHKLSYWHEQILKNDTLFRLVTDQEFLHPKSQDAFKKYFRPSKYVDDNRGKFKAIALKDFNINEDVIVYLHIQKVGGTVFNGHLINDLDKGFDCHCTKHVVMNPCHCKNKAGNIWLFSWFTVGWPCGLHADWTMMHECVDKEMNKLEGIKRHRRYFYIALLRDPISRYLSEWQHQRLGQHWEEAKLKCGGQSVGKFDVYPCFQEHWKECTLNEFMNCRDNLATNRQTRMLADLTLSDCYKRRTQFTLLERAESRLKSSMDNIQTLPFFGLTERQTETQHLFEKTFGLKFNKRFESLNDNEEEDMISEDEFVNIMKFIELDMQLYLFAGELFKERLRQSI
ncbi:H6S1A-like protein [Mya arenaria]|uniref:Heparan-sulfate 6-O-sulfotransferase n=1 Tax=Mya arenaria TaxID=6604 RepID=A0ABY7G658_MYAAR|nr:heparan-sulfate 6-O-sulfotransferase 1-A-like [Mya arenaria]XP_052782445.1 heparan-sulfate 6-O-sulfotransferase 1-A-like [Mya arenaria]WAR28551.1 H6S1A-like protein [Mya arenaria]